MSTTLQPGKGPIDGDHYLRSDLENIRWGRLPNRSSAPVMELAPGSTVTIDSVSHEGILEDQGREPVAYLAEHGIAAADVLDDAKEIATGGVEHDFDDDGPHVVVGPIAISGARPGDILRAEVVTLRRRAFYGFVSSRHGAGALPGEFPRGERRADASPSEPAAYGSICKLATVIGDRDRGDLGVIPYGNGREARFPLNPFMGLVGVAQDTDEPVHSVPPGRHGGNLDISVLGESSVLYLPVQVDGALFYAGDPHFSQGNGEVSLTAFEAPLRATYRLSLVEASEAEALVGLLRSPFAETRTHWVAIGLDRDLNEAMRKAVRAAVGFLEGVVGMDGAEALAYLSATSDFEVSQVVDDVKGIHCLIRKADFPGREPSAG